MTMRDVIARIEQQVSDILARERIPGAAVAFTIDHRP